MSEQSALVAQGLHAPPLHKEAVALLQSALDKHSAQLLAVVLHSGFEASLQSVLARQPTQVFDEASQTGLVGSLQSDDATHSTQVFVSVLHAGLVAEYVQSVLVRHSTQVLSVAQTAFGAAQLVFLVQATHA
jgi:hypothetical protein